MGWQDAPIIGASKNKWEEAPLIEPEHPLELQFPTTEVESPGIFSRIGKDISNRVSGVETAFTEPISSIKGGWSGDEKAGLFEAVPQRLLRAGGEAVALAGDVTGELLKSGYQAIPKGARDWGAARVEGVIHPEVRQAGVEALKQGGDAYAKFREAFPEEAKNLEAVLNIAISSPIAREYKNIAKDVGKMGIRALPASIEERLYGSATKMPLSKKWVKTASPEQLSTRAKAIKEGIKSEVLPTESGLNKIIRLEKEALSEVDDVIKRLSTEGKTIKRNDLLKGLDNAYRTAEESSFPDVAKGVLDNLRNTILKHPENMPAGLVQRIKRQWYKESTWTGTTPTGVGAQFTQKGRKGVANAAMNALEELNPALKGLNQTDAARIALKEGIERAVGRIGNRNISDLGSEIMSGAGAVVGGAPGAAAGFTLKKLIEMPEIKSKMAFALHRARTSGAESNLGKLLTRSTPPSMPPITPPTKKAGAVIPKAERRGIGREVLTAGRQAEVELARKEGNQPLLHKLLYEDPDIPGLLNKKAWVKDEPAIMAANKDVIFADGIGVKWGNDKVGYKAGDDLLSSIATISKKYDLDIYRVGGDEFAIVGGKGVAARLKEANAELAKKNIGGYTGFTIRYARGEDKAQAAAKVNVGKERSIQKGKEVQRGELPLGVTKVGGSTKNLNFAPDEEISITDFVRKYGGLSVEKEALKGEIRDRLTIKEGYNLVNNKTGRTLDDMTQGAIAGGYLPEGSTIRDLLDIINKDIVAKKVKTQTGRSWSKFKQNWEVPDFQITAIQFLENGQTVKNTKVNAKEALKSVDDSIAKTKSILDKLKD